MGLRTTWRRHVMSQLDPSPQTGGFLRLPRRHAGFSLIELLVVVAVMLIIAGIAVPALLRSRIASNEAAVTASMRVITSMNVRYMLTFQQGFAPDLHSLGPPPMGSQPSGAAADLIDSVLASGIKSGYSLVYVPLDPAGTGTPTGFTLNANPVSPGQTGNRYFYVDQTNTIHVSTSGPADRNSPSL
jgi:type IV pilus assembly protein PilA